MKEINYKCENCDRKIVVNKDEYKTLANMAKLMVKLFNYTICDGVETQIVLDEVTNCCKNPNYYMVNKNWDLL